MAYTKIIVIHNRLDKCVNYTQDKEKTSLSYAINYAMNREKTEQSCFETAINCDREQVYEDMMETKRRWGKTERKRKGYHIIQSFVPGETSPEQAHAIGVEFAQRLLGEQYEVVVTTHLDKAHLHNHIVFNSVSFVDGKMYQDKIADYYEGIRGTSDAICRERDLSIIEPSEQAPKGYVSRAEWEAQKQGKPTLRELVRRDIDTAVSKSYTMRSFWHELEVLGYEIKRGSNVAHTAVRPPWGKRFIRLDSLNEGYTEQDIQIKVSAARSGDIPPAQAPIIPTLLVVKPAKHQYRVQGTWGKPRKLKGFRALYFKYLYLLGAVPKRRPKNRAALSMKSEIIKFHRYQEQFTYLMKNRIETEKQLTMQYDAIQAEIDALTERRKQLYPYRQIQGGEQQIAEINSQLRSLRQELKLCIRIENDIPTIRAYEVEMKVEHEKADKSRPHRDHPFGSELFSGARRER